MHVRVYCVILLAFVECKHNRRTEGAYDTWIYTNPNWEVRAKNIVYIAWVSGHSVVGLCTCHTNIVCCCKWYQLLK